METTFNINLFYPLLFLFMLSIVITIGIVCFLLSVTIIMQFKLVNEITNKNLGKLLKYYNDLVMMGNHPSMILMMIANQFRLIYQVKVLSREIFDEYKIANTLCVHPYQVKLAMGKCSMFSEGELLNILHELSMLDEDIKLGRIMLDNSLESFFVKLCNN